MSSRLSVESCINLTGYVSNANWIFKDAQLTQSNMDYVGR